MADWLNFVVPASLPRITCFTAQMQHLTALVLYCVAAQCDLPLPFVIHAFPLRGTRFWTQYNGNQLLYFCYEIFPITRIFRSNYSIVFSEVCLRFSYNVNVARIRATVNYDSIVDWQVKFNLFCYIWCLPAAGNICQFGSRWLFTGHPVQQKLCSFSRFMRYIHISNMCERLQSCDTPQK